MKKKTVKKPQTKQTAARGVKIKTSERASATSSWTMSIYVYWFIILFFIAATFYILGRSYAPKDTTPQQEVVEIIETSGPASQEEKLMQAPDYYERAKSEIIAGNVENSITDLTAAIKSDANFVDAYILRGEAYLQTGDYRSAMADFNSVLELDTKNSIAYYDRSLLNTRLENYEAAMSDINNAIASFAEHPNEVLQMRDLYAKRGQLNLWIKNWEGAIADYTNSLARPEGTVSPDVYAERAEAYTAIGQYALAAEDYASAVRVISEQIQGALATEQKEDLSVRAMSYFEKSAALNLNIGNVAMAKSDLQSAYAIAASLNDAENAERLQRLFEEIQ